MIISPQITYARGLEWLGQRQRLLYGDGFKVIRICQNDWVIRLKESICLEDARSVLELYQNNAPQTQLLKDDKKRRIARVHLSPQRSLVLKEYKRNFRWELCSADRRAWLNANRLQGACPCLAWFRCKQSPHTAYILMEDAGEDTLRLDTAKVNLQEAEELMTASGRLLATLHNMNIFDADCKCDNFTYKRLDSRQISISIIDCDDIRPYWHLSFRRKLKNLAQFLGLQNRLSLEDKPALLKRFLLEYAAASHLSLQKLQRALPQMQAMTERLYPYPNMHHEILGTLLLT